MPNRLLKDREFKDAVVGMTHDQTDVRIYQGIIIKNLGRIENKINHLTTVTKETYNTACASKDLSIRVSNRAKRSP